MCPKSLVWDWPTNYNLISFPPPTYIIVAISCVFHMRILRIFVIVSALLNRFFYCSRARCALTVCLQTSPRSLILLILDRQNLGVSRHTFSNCIRVRGPIFCVFEAVPQERSVFLEIQEGQLYIFIYFS